MCGGTREIELTVQGIRVRVQALVPEKRIEGSDVVMGMDYLVNWVRLLF